MTSVAIVVVPMWNLVPDPILGAPTLALPYYPPAGPCVSLDTCIFQSSRCSHNSFCTITNAAGLHVSPPTNGLSTSVLPTYDSAVALSTAAATAPASSAIQRIHIPMAGGSVPLTASHSSPKPLSASHIPNPASPVSDSTPVLRLPTASVAAEGSTARVAAHDSTARVDADNAAGGNTDPASGVVPDRQTAVIAEQETPVAAGLPEGATVNIPEAVTADADPASGVVMDRQTAIIADQETPVAVAPARVNIPEAVTAGTPGSNTSHVTDIAAAALTDTAAAAVRGTAAAPVTDIAAIGATAIVAAPGTDIAATGVTDSTACAMAVTAVDNLEDDAAPKPDSTSSRASSHRTAHPTVPGQEASSVIDALGGWLYRICGKIAGICQGLYNALWR